MQINRGWSNPLDYVSQKTKDYKKSSEWKKSIFLLWKLYSATLIVFKSSFKTSVQKNERLEPYYEKLIVILEDLLDLKCLAYLREYYPKLAGKLNKEVLSMEYEDWYLQDLDNFQELIDDEIKNINFKSYVLPEGIISIGNKIEKIIKENSNDKEKLEKIFAKSKHEHEELGEKIIIRSDGLVQLTTISGETYKAEFSINSNPYKFIVFLANHPFRNNSFDNIAQALTKKDSEIMSERQIRDIATFIRKRFKLPKNSKFLSSDYGFSINCRIVRAKI